MDQSDGKLQGGLTLDKDYWKKKSPELLLWIRSRIGRDDELQLVASLGKL
jgi:hypothetical protein